MPLSEYEQRTLDEIEEWMEQDPKGKKLVAQLTPPKMPNQRFHTAMSWTLFVTAVLVCVAALFLDMSVGIFEFGFTCFAGFYFGHAKSKRMKAAKSIKRFNSWLRE